MTERLMINSMQDIKICPAADTASDHQKQMMDDFYC